jgi:hypothetical protein
LVGAGFAPWHVADQSRDEVFMAAQESVGAHRDSQGKIQRPATFIFLGITGHCMFWFQLLLMSKLCWAYRIENPELVQEKFLSPVVLMKYRFSLLCGTSIVLIEMKLVQYF